MTAVRLESSCAIVACLIFQACSGTPSNGSTPSGGGTGLTGGTHSGGTGLTGGTHSGGTGLTGGTHSGGTFAPSSGGVTNTGGRLATGGTPTLQGGTTSASSSCCAQFGTAAPLTQVPYTNIVEMSGMVASRAHPGVLYVHEDSGASAVFYGLSTTGDAIGTFTLSGAGATDWEDISVGPGPSVGTFVYLGDIGDNAARTGSGTPRTEIQVYRVPEPDVTAAVSLGSQSLTNWQRLRFTYPDSAHDAETLMVDPTSGDIVIVTKETSGASKVFRAPGSTAADTPTVLEAVATLSIGAAGSDGALVTSGDFAPDGNRVILRSYAAIWLWCRAGTLGRTFGVAPTQVTSASEPKGEGLTFSADGKAWLSAGEQSLVVYQAVSSCQ